MRCVSPCPHTSRLPALFSILLRRLSVPVQGHAFWTGLICSADISVNRKGVRSTATHAGVKTSFLPRRLVSPQHLQGHSEVTDDFTHQECKIGLMVYERGEVRTDSLPGLHIHRDSLLHPCGTNVPPPDRIVKILSRIRQLSALMFCQAREFLSLLGLLNSAADQIPHWIILKSRSERKEFS
jgi:hypothetical protein